MSEFPTAFRPFARMGSGGNAASHFRGAVAVPIAGIGLPVEFPQSLGPSWRGQIGTVIYRGFGAAQNLSIAGVTRDSTGTPLANCRVELYQTGGDIPTATVTSDAFGNFSFDSPGSGPFYLVAYKAGSPDVAGTTVNTLIA